MKSSCGFQNYSDSKCVAESLIYCCTWHEISFLLQLEDLSKQPLIYTSINQCTHTETRMHTTQIYIHIHTLNKIHKVIMYNPHLLRRLLLLLLYRNRLKYKMKWLAT